MGVSGRLMTCGSVFDDSTCDQSTDKLVAARCSFNELWKLVTSAFGVQYSRNPSYVKAKPFWSSALGTGLSGCRRIALYIKAKAWCDKLATVVGRIKLTTLATVNES